MDSSDLSPPVSAKYASGPDLTKPLEDFCYKEPEAIVVDITPKRVDLFQGNKTTLDSYTKGSFLSLLA